MDKVLLCIGLIIVCCIKDQVWGKECFDLVNGLPKYDGTINMTLSGIPCQHWNSAVPQTPYYVLGEEHKNYCRTPDNYTALWCYTMDPNVRWESCNVPQCDTGDCYKYVEGIPRYNGTKSVTASNRMCQPWNSSEVHIPNYVLGPEHQNYCRNPSDYEILWCYTMDYGLRWESCNVSLCESAPTEATEISTSRDPTSIRSDEIYSITTPQRFFWDANKVTSTSTDGSMEDMKEITDLVSSTNYVNLFTTSLPISTRIPTEEIEGTTNSKDFSEMSTGFTNLTEASITGSQACHCNCQPSWKYWSIYYYGNLTQQEKNAILENEKQRIRNELRMQKYNLSSYIRSRTSATDNRFSSQSIGLVGVLVLTISVLLIVSADLSNRKSFSLYSVQRTTRKKRRTVF